MDRRTFLRNTLLTSAIYGVGLVPGFAKLARAEGFATVNQRMVVNIMLNGAPDLRHVFPPPYSGDINSFGYNYWKANTTAHALEDNDTARQAKWSNEYTQFNANGHSFGILDKCGWLQDMFNQGKVALICNAYGVSSRDHVHGQLVMNQGNVSSSRLDVLRSGWGGRLASVANSNVVSLTRSPSEFCFGPDDNDPENHNNFNLIAMPDSRKPGLFIPNADSGAIRTNMADSLEQFYKGLREDKPEDSPFRRFVEIERTLRDFGTPMNERLNSIPIPDAIARLYDANHPEALNVRALGTQIRNLYDVLANNDILNMRVASMEFDGFDTHKNQKEDLEDRMEDMFGTNRGLDSLMQSLPNDAKANTLFVIAGEFGRQIRSNGDNGTDHGEGTIVLLIGDDVNGGVYGNMFPQPELDRLWTEGTPQIIGETSIEHVFATAAEWFQPGGGSLVFPDKNSTPIESGLNINSVINT